MKILLINPSQHVELFPDVYLPLGIMYVASSLRNAGHHVKIIDLQFDSITNLINELKLFSPDVVGITCTTPTFPLAEQIAKTIKEINKNIYVVLGGIHATSNPVETLKSEFIDFVVIGEGEETTVDLLDALQYNKNLKNVKGIGFKENGKIIINPPRPPIENLDELPLPAYDLVDMEQYKKYRNAIMIFTSRGCPFNCIFCASHLIFGKKVRRRSIENVIEELKLLKNKYGITHIAFYDDTFTLDKKYVIELCKRMIEEKLDFKWWCNTRVNTVDEELLRRMKKAGCVEISYGFESGTQRVLDFMKKGITIEQSRKAAEITRKVGIDMHGFFIINFPTERKEEMIKTIKFARELPLKWFRVSLATPYPGTELFEICIKNNLLSEEQLQDWSRYNYLKEFYIPNPNVSEKEIKKLLRNADIMLILKRTWVENALKKILMRIMKGDFYIFIRGLRYIRNILSIR
jgi:radical SAM superfamily enzyme YgiQ (UPF0313 family)